MPTVNAQYSSRESGASETQGHAVMKLERNKTALMFLPVESPSRCTRCVARRSAFPQNLIFLSSFHLPRCCVSWWTQSSTNMHAVANAASKGPKSSRHILSTKLHTVLLGQLRWCQLSHGTLEAAPPPQELYFLLLSQNLARFCFNIQSFGSLSEEHVSRSVGEFLQNPARDASCTHAEVLARRFDFVCCVYSLCPGTNCTDVVFSKWCEAPTRQASRRQGKMICLCGLSTQEAVGKATAGAISQGVFCGTRWNNCFSHSRTRNQNQMDILWFSNENEIAKLCFDWTLRYSPLLGFMVAMEWKFLFWTHLHFSVVFWHLKIILETAISCFLTICTHDCQGKATLQSWTKIEALGAEKSVLECFLSNFIVKVNFKFGSFVLNVYGFSIMSRKEFVKFEFLGSWG